MVREERVGMAREESGDGEGESGGVMMGMYAVYGGCEGEWGW